MARAGDARGTETSYTAPGLAQGPRVVLVGDGAGPLAELARAQGPALAACPAQARAGALIRRYRASTNPNPTKATRPARPARIKMQTVLPSAETAAMPFWASLASGQIAMRKVDGCQSLGQPPSTSTIDLAA